MIIFNRLKKLLKWVVVAFFASTILSVVALRFLPVYFTPLMFIRLGEQIAKGERKVVSFYEARKTLLEVMERYETNTVVAHNARFDLNALNVTQRWLTKSKYRYFFPFGTEIWDTMKMAKDVVACTPTYKAFCERNGYMTKHKNPQPRITAEILYRFISGDNSFTESHTGLEDVDIERQILAYCFRKHKAMRKALFA